MNFFEICKKIYNRMKYIMCNYVSSVDKQEKYEYHGQKVNITVKLGC